MIRLVARSIEDIGSILEYVRGGKIELDKITADEKTRSIDITLRVIEKEAQVVGNILCLRKWRHNILNACLSIHNARRCGIVDETGKGVGIITAITRENDIVTVECEKAIAIKTPITEFFIELVVTDQTAGSISYYSRRIRQKSR